MRAIVGYAANFLASVVLATACSPRAEEQSAPVEAYGYTGGELADAEGIKTDPTQGITSAFFTPMKPDPDIATYRVHVDNSNAICGITGLVIDPQRADMVVMNITQQLGEPKLVIDDALVWMKGGMIVSVVYLDNGEVAVSHNITGKCF